MFLQLILRLLPYYILLPDIRRLTKESVLLHSVELNDVDKDDLKQQQNIYQLFLEPEWALSQ